jgi:NADH dehydrogenase
MYPWIHGGGLRPAGTDEGSLMGRDHSPDDRPPPWRILILGGGNVGMTVARQLGRRLRPGEAEVVLADPRSHLTYQPLLAEAAAGNVEPRHVAVPLRRVLPHARVITAELVRLDHGIRRAVVRVSPTEYRELAYDQVVVVPGSTSRVLPISGLAELGIGFRSIGEAVYLRNHLLDRLAFAGSTADRRARRQALTFVVVGAGYSGVEAVGELSDMTAAVAPVFGIDPAELRWVLVEATRRILPEVGPELAAYTLRVLRGRGIEVLLGTNLVSCVDGQIQLSGRPAFDSDTLVWTAGVHSNPILANTDLPRDDRGRLVADPDLRVRDTTAAWTAGDCAAVPDLTSDQPGALCAPTAQHAVRQAKRLADNLVGSLRGGRLREYRHRYAGSVASLGRFQGVAEVYGVRLRGLPAWLLHRGYHLSHLPSRARQVRILADWVLGAVFPRDVVSLGEIHQPRELFLRSLGEAETPARRPYPSPTRRPGSTEASTSGTM